MNKNYLFLGLILVFSVFLVSNVLAQETRVIPEGKDVLIEFSGFQEIKLETNHSTNIIFSFYENNNWINASLDIKSINEENVTGNLTVNGTDSGTFTLNSGKDQTINLTKKTPFIVTNTYVLTKDEVNRAVIKLRLPFITIGQDIENPREPKFSFIDQSTIPEQVKTDSLSLKILLIVVIVLLILIIIIVKIRK